MDSADVDRTVQRRITARRLAASLAAVVLTFAAAGDRRPRPALTAPPSNREQQPTAPGPSPAPFRRTMDPPATPDVSSRPARAGVAQLAERHLPKVDVAVRSRLPLHSRRTISPARRRAVAVPGHRYPSRVTDAPPVDPRRFTSRFPVRQHELDLLGHVNNAVYLNWAEQVAIDHVEALGFGRDWATARGGGWVVREHRVTYHRPVRYGDVVLVTTLPQQLGGVRGVRRTEIAGSRTAPSCRGGHGLDLGAAPGWPAGARAGGSAEAFGGLTARSAGSARDRRVPSSAITMTAATMSDTSSRVVMATLTSRPPRWIRLRPGKRRTRWRPFVVWSSGPRRSRAVLPSERRSDEARRFHAHRDSGRRSRARQAVLRRAVRLDLRARGTRVRGVSHVPKHPPARMPRPGDREARGEGARENAQLRQCRLDRRHGGKGR